MRLAPGAAEAASPLRSAAVRAAHAAAVAVLALGVAAVLLRPTAPIIDPADPLARFDTDHLRVVAAYRGARYAAAALGLAVSLAIPLAVALTPAGRRWIDRIASRIGPARPARAAALIVVAVVVATDIALLPLTFWVSFVHEGAFGLRTQSIGGWAYDWLVGRATGWLAAAGLALGGYALIRRLPKAWPPAAGLAAAGMTAVLAFLAPVILEPLWLRTAELPSGDARQAVEEVLDRADVDVDSILIADASRRTTKHNAYISGLAQTRRIVVWDTLVADQSPAQVAMVVAHELGHQLHADVARSTLFAGAGAVAVAYVLATLLRWRAGRGAQDGQGDPRGAALALAAVVVLTAISLPVQSWVSRRAEAAADLTSLNLTADPMAYLEMHRSLARANLSDPAPPAWVHLLWFSHPTVAQRLEMGARWPDVAIDASQGDR